MEYRTFITKFRAAAGAVAFAGMIATSGTALATPAADVIFVVDESGSMSGEHAWLGTMVASMEANLIAAGVGGGIDKNRYGLVGFGSSASGHGTSQGAHTHTVGSGEFGTSAEFSTATSSLIASGGFEDGYEAILHALSFSTIRTASDVAPNIILVTDEDRDITSGSTASAASMLAALTDAGAVLNAVLDAPITKSGNPNAIGLDDEGNAYVADGSGGYTTDTGYSVTTSGDFGTSKEDYSDLALATGGASWDLNILRLGGLNATSFTEAFINVKVAEIQDSVVPEPASMGLFGLGIFGLAAIRRRRKA